MHVLDTHVHLVEDPDWVRGEHQGPVRRPFTAADFRDHAAGTEVTALVSVPSLPTVAETRRMLAVAAADPTVAAVVGWVDLTAPDVGAQLDALMATPGSLRGIRHSLQREPDPDWLMRTDVLAGLRELAERDLLFEILARGDQLDAAVRMSRQRPDLTLVLDHAGNPPLATGDLTDWERHLRRLAQHERLVCKVSGPMVHAERSTLADGALDRSAQLVRDIFGPCRTLVGSNYPLCLLTGDYDAAWRRGLSLVAEVSGDARQVHATARTLYIPST
ncbi:amidohydrolase family protein [Ruania alba]|uniref:L-fuconolactonase n=1 Tax=Ruania alba TaxID=648782 RepID=A0A1H5HK31_9MICO|nr:amidohydrolase family protein [Ruania alba]SEE28369.1 L-fuconolactonase [Ruania alba]